MSPKLEALQYSMPGHRLTGHIQTLAEGENELQHTLVNKRKFLAGAWEGRRFFFITRRMRDAEMSVSSTISKGELKAIIYEQAHTESRQC